MIIFLTYLRPKAEKIFRFFTLIFCGALLQTPSIAAGISWPPTDDLMATVQALSATKDRSTGTAGNEKAAAYIEKRFSDLGFTEMGTHYFSVPVLRHGKSTFSLPDRSLIRPIQPFKGNAISPGTISPQGLEGPLIYAGPGEFKNFNGKTVDGSIVLMELNSGKNWLHAANLGAKALIYVDRGDTPKTFFEEKIELSPVRFPRFWMPLSRLRELFGRFEDAPGDFLANRMRLTSDISWQEVTGKNIYCLIPGVQPDRQEELIIVEAFYDSTALVAGRSPGAD